MDSVWTAGVRCQSLACSKDAVSLGVVTVVPMATGQAMEGLKKNNKKTPQTNAQVALHHNLGKKGYFWTFL